MFAVKAGEVGYAWVSFLSLLTPTGFLMGGNPSVFAFTFDLVAPCALELKKAPPGSRPQSNY